LSFLGEYCMFQLVVVASGSFAVGATSSQLSKSACRWVAISLLATVAWMRLSQLSLAEGYVSVRAGTVGVDLNDSDDNPLLASATVSGASGGAAYNASATVVFNEIENVKMRAYAYASSPPVINPDRLSRKLRGIRES
jgi:hypothetical protein